MVLLLLANGADPTVACKDGREDTTPLWLACFHGLTDVVHPLLDNGADANVLCYGSSPLHVAAARGLIQVCQILCDYPLPRGANVNLNSERLGTALHVSVRRGHHYVLDLLLSYEPNVNVQDKNGETIFHLACGGNYATLVDKLLSSKLHIDPFVVDSVRGATAAHYTTSVPIFKKLIRKWPQLFYAQDAFHRTPSFYIPCDVVALLTSITSKLHIQTLEHIYDDIPRNADLALICPSTTPESLLSKEGMTISEKNLDSNHAAKEENDISTLGEQIASVTIPTPTERVLCHKAMLYARVPYYQTQLQSQASRQFDATTVSKNSSMETMETTFSADVMRAVVHFMYTDNLKCPKHALKELLEASRVLQLKRLAELTKRSLGDSVEISDSLISKNLTCLLTSPFPFADVQISVVPDHYSRNAASTASKHVFSVHKFVLMSVSEYFRTMFSVDMEESRSGVAVVPASSPALFEIFLHWAYTGELKSTLKTMSDCYNLLELGTLLMAHDLSLPVQTKLLTILENNEWDKLGEAFVEAERLNAQIVAEQCALRFRYSSGAAAARWRKVLPAQIMQQLEALASIEEVKDKSDERNPLHPAATRSAAGKQMQAKRFT